MKGEFLVNVFLTHLAGGRRGEKESFSADRISLGRGPSNSVVLGPKETKVSTRHAEIIAIGESFRIEDLASTNGTYINGQQITSAELHNGDIFELGLGGPRFKFEIDEPIAEQADKVVGPHIQILKTLTIRVQRLLRFYMRAKIKNQRRQ